MKLAKIETFTNEFVCFVRITTDEGHQGWGQSAPYYADITATVLHRMVAPHMLGLDTTNIDAMTDRVTEKEHKFPGSFLRRAIGGVDTALWDMKAKLQQKSVCELIGGTPGPVRAYASSMKRDITPKDEADRFNKLRDKFGFDAFKFRVGAECGNDIDEWPGRTEEIVPTIREALDDTVELLVDGNSGFSVERAIKVGHMLQDNGVCHFEEPCRYWEYAQTKQVTDALELDVTVDSKTVDIVQPDICYLGGLSRTLRVAKMAELADIPVTPHCANLSMVTLFTMHLLRSIPNAGKYLEFSIEGLDYYPWQDQLFVESPFGIIDGKATVTNEPGWGAEVHPDWLANAAYAVSAR